MTVLTQRSTAGARLAAYLRERFPVGATGLLSAAFFLAGAWTAGALAAPGQPLRLGGAEAAGMATLLLVFFHLRLFDEFKDHARDARAHPGRLLSRGVVTLGFLARLLAAVLALELLLNAWLGPRALLPLALVGGYSLLMRFEFFAGDWLARRPLAYTLSHTFITPLLTLYMAGFAPAPLRDPRFLLFAAVAFAGTLSYEVGRKTWAPEQEHPDADSYSKLFGPRGAALLGLGLTALSGLLTALLAWRLGLHPLALAWVAALTAAALLPGLAFLRRPVAPAARRLALASSLHLLGSLAGLAAALAAAHGVTPA